MNYQTTGHQKDSQLSKSSGSVRPKSSEKAGSKKPKPEETFYENLTLGLKNTLANVPRVCDVRCEMRQPCEKAQVVNWEQRHSVYLPEDMKKFYLSTDGFIFQWSYQYAADDTRRVGFIHFPHLLQITLLRENVEIGSGTTNATVTSAALNLMAGTSGNKTNTLIGAIANDMLNGTGQSTSSSSSMPMTSQALGNHSIPAIATKDRWGNPLPVLTPKTKIFELNNVNDMAKVCLVYESTGTSSPKIYLLELNSFQWQFLAESFSEYLRMSIAHLGLPFWELCFSSFGLPSWTEQLFLLLAPHLLEEHEQRRSRIVHPASEHPHNVLDANTFRLKPKGASKSTSSTIKHK